MNIAVILALGAGLAGHLVGQGLPPARPTIPPPVQLPLPAPGRNDLTGGVAPAGAISQQPVALTLEGAIERGLRNNLGPLLAGSASEQARAQRLTALAALLPRVDASAGEVRQKINLA